jgi:hypothetical protein
MEHRRRELEEGETLVTRPPWSNVTRLVGDGSAFDLPAGFGERLKASLAQGQAS